MKKTLFWLSLASLFAFVPAFALAAPIDFSGLITVPKLEGLPHMSCSVVGSIKRTNTVVNEITYKVSYDSNYGKLNAPYTVYGTVDRTTSNITVYQAAGAASFVSGEGYMTLKGNTENKFVFAIKNNPEVMVSATINGTKCTSKVFKTIPAPSLIQPRIDLSDLSINTSSLAASTTLEVNPPAPVEEQFHTCKMLIEAVSLDDDSILIGGAISAQNLKIGQYPYIVRGYRTDTPNNVTKYEGVYNAKLDSRNTIILGQEGKSFRFTYDSKVNTDAYIITATLGNIDCSSVLFPSHLQGIQNSGNENNENTGETTINNSVSVVGLTDTERQEGENLDLLPKTDSPDAKVPESDFDDAQKQNNSAAVNISQNSEQEWTSRDLVIAGLLSAILLSLITYGVMKYRGTI